MIESWDDLDRAMSGVSIEDRIARAFKDWPEPHLKYKIHKGVASSVWYLCEGGANGLTHKVISTADSFAEIHNDYLGQVS
jgi:hypothetical protein